MIVLNRSVYTGDDELANDDNIVNSYQLTVNIFGTVYLWALKLTMTHCTALQESPAVADKPARRLRKVCTVYIRAVGL